MKTTTALKETMIPIGRVIQKTLDHHLRNLHHHLGREQLEEWGGQAELDGLG